MSNGELSIVRSNAFIKATTTTNNGLAVTVENSVFDSLTGNPIVTKTTSPSEEFPRISVSKPAYTLYTGMKDKNMLTQIYQKSDFIDYNKNGVAEPNECLTSTVDEWHPQDLPDDANASFSTKQWFFDKNWQWQSENSSSVENSPLRDENGNYKSAHTSDWLLISSVDSFTTEGTPLQETNVDGITSCVLRAYPDSHDVAIVVDATLEECFYDSFEDNFIYNPTSKTWQESNWVDASLTTTDVYSGKNAVNLTDINTVMTKNITVVHGHKKMYQIG